VVWLSDSHVRWNADASKNPATGNETGKENSNTARQAWRSRNPARSGHSIFGAMLNAHKDAVISHELMVPPLILKGCSRNDVYSQIIARADWFNMRGNRTNYQYEISGQWQGKFESLRVIGDKRGGDVSCTIIEHPDLLQRVRTLVGVLLRLIHAIRNPYVNIAAISIWHRIPLMEEE